MSANGSGVVFAGGLDMAMTGAMRQVKEAGFTVRHVEQRAAVLRLLREDGSIKLVFCAWALAPDLLCAELRAERLHVPVIACGDAILPAPAAAAIRAGCADVINLSGDPGLIAALLAQSGDSSAPIVSDPAMQAVIRRAEQLARADASVLILGESGTGKEVMARHIHRHSRRAAGPFIALNCAALPEQLLESEMFGHEKGAFSGAVSRRIGRFEAAGGGTLLLDEISEMDVRLQAKLLRAIQEREIERLGGNETVRVDVRILATSNRDLSTEIKAGRFLADLYFRLNVVSLDLPALRHRPRDIAVLAAHYARHYADLNGFLPRQLSENALEKLQQYFWPGNVRELENTVHRAVLLAEGDRIDADSIELPQISAPPAGAAMVAGEEAWVGKSLSDVEQDFILRTLTHTAGNRTHAAAMLGISLRALRNKLRDYGGRGIAVPPPGGIAA
jgi:DNA-binding NtrC family response regulator